MKIIEETGQKDGTQKQDKQILYYDPLGKTDPFEPFVTISEKRERAKEDEVIKKEELNRRAEEERLRKLMEPKTELQTFSIYDLKLTTLIKDNNTIWGIVKAPNGKGYLLKEGVYVGKKGGIVEKIVFENKETPLGIQIERKVIVKEPFINKDGDIDYRPIEMKMAGM